MFGSCLAFAILLCILTRPRLTLADGIGDLALLQQSVTSKAGNISALANSTAPANGPVTVSGGEAMGK